MSPSRTDSRSGGSLITDWINAFASVFASVGTVGAFIVGGALLRKEAARDRSRSEQERKAQASGVHAWVEVVHASVPNSARERPWVNYRTGPVQHPDTRELQFTSDLMIDFPRETRKPPDDGEGAVSFVVRIKNRSKGPVFDLYVEQASIFAPLQMYPRDRHVTTGANLLDKMPQKSAVYRSLLSAGEEFEHYYSLFLDKSGLVALDCPVTIVFTDTHGHRWHRDRAGLLTELAVSENPKWVTAVDSVLGI
jgi:hypothetical protein